MGFNDRWLAHWIEKKSNSGDHGDIVDDSLYIWLYIIGTLVFLIFLIISSALVQIGAARAARSLHADCVASVMRAPVSYFEATPSGRLISRFSSDVTTADNALSQFGDNWLQFVSTIVVYFVVVIMILPQMVVAAVLVGIGTWLQVVAVDRSNREVKRMANAAMAPILTDVSETTDARLLLRHCAYEPFLPTAAAAVLQPPAATATEFHAQAFFEARFDSDSDEYLLLNFCSCALVNWSQQVSYLVSLCFSVGVAIQIVLRADTLEPSQSALSLSYRSVALVLPGQEAWINVAFTTVCFHIIRHLETMRD